jgi:glyoxylase-like metal-dependent hydrolase (beta-lactamase superfamily II)
MRKSIIALAATVVAAQAMLTASAQTTSPEENIFRYRVGDFEVMLLSEGQSAGGTGNLIDAPAERIVPYLSEDGTYPTATNAFAVIAPRETLLIDAGVGRRLTENIAAAGIDSLGAIWLTHMHGDHIGGLVKDGVRVFDAPLTLGTAEAEYWAGQEGSAKTVLDLYQPRTMELYRLEEVPLGRNGIFPIEAYGHTPGHTVFLVVSGGEKLLIWGDVAHAMAVQMPLPEISVRYDVDPDAARATRAKILEYVVENKIPVAGMHIPYPGIGTIEKAAEGYRFTPITE